MEAQVQQRRAPHPEHGQMHLRTNVGGLVRSGPPLRETAPKLPQGSEARSRRGSSGSCAGAAAGVERSGGGRRRQERTPGIRTCIPCIFADRVPSCKAGHRKNLLTRKRQCLACQIRCLTREIRCRIRPIIIAPGEPGTPSPLLPGASGTMVPISQGASKRRGPHGTEKGLGRERKRSA